MTESLGIITNTLSRVTEPDFGEIRSSGRFWAKSDPRTLFSGYLFKKLGEMGVGRVKFWVFRKTRFRP